MKNDYVFKISQLLLLVFMLCSLAACSSDSDGEDDGPDYNLRGRLADAESWTYVIQDQWDPGKIDRIAESDYDVVVIDNPRTIVDLEDYDAKADVAKLHAAGKIVLNYIDIGEAEDYRTYWLDGWSVGEPAWILADDPDGWSGNFPVAFWEDDWHAIVYDGENSLLAQSLEDGYDGIYMDWIEAVSFENVVAAAEAEGIDAHEEMKLLIQGIRETAHDSDPDYLIVAQNAMEMRHVSGYLDLLDGEAQEQIWFDGAADVMGTDPRQGDCRLPEAEGEAPPESNADYCNAIDTMQMSSQEYIDGLLPFLEAGIPVFTVDYALDEDNAAFVYERARALGFKPYVTMRSLEDLSDTPPFDFE